MNESLATSKEALSEVNPRRFRSAHKALPGIPRARTNWGDTSTLSAALPRTACSLAVEVITRCGVCRGLLAANFHGNLGPRISKSWAANFANRGAEVVPNSSFEKTPKYGNPQGNFYFTIKFPFKNQNVFSFRNCPITPRAPSGKIGRPRFGNFSGKMFGS